MFYSFCSQFQVVQFGSSKGAGCFAESSCKNEVSVLQKITWASEWLGVSDATALAKLSHSAPPLDGKGIYVNAYRCPEIRKIIYEWLRPWRATDNQDRQS